MDNNKLNARALESAWLAYDNACPGEHWKKRERMAIAIQAYRNVLRDEGDYLKGSTNPVDA